MLMIQAGAIALIALILTPGLLFYFDVTPKLLVLLVAAGVSLVPLRRSRLTWLVVLTLVSARALAPRSVRIRRSRSTGTRWRQFGALGQAAVLILAWALSAQTKRIGVILRVVSAAGALTALYGIAQYFGWDPILPAAAYHIGEGIWTIVRPPSTLGYVSYFATWLLFVVFLSLALPGRLAKVCAALALIAMLLTGTRAALLGFAAGAAVWGGMKRGCGDAASCGAAGFAGAALLAGLALYVSPLGQPLRSRARWFAEDPWGGARPLLWRDSLRMGLARPLAGYGPETFRAAFPHYESAALARAYPDFAHESAHNIFLDALVAQGIAGLLLLGAWCVLGFAAHCRFAARHPDLAACLAAALAAGVVSQQFTVFTIPTAVIFFATIALAAGLAGGAVGPVRALIPLALPLLYFAARIALRRSCARAGAARSGCGKFHRRGRALRGLGTDQRPLVFARPAGGGTKSAPDRRPSAGFPPGRRGRRTRHADGGGSVQRLVQPVVDSRRAKRHGGHRALPAGRDRRAPHVVQAALDAGSSPAPASRVAKRRCTKPHWPADLDGGKHPEVTQTLQELRGR